MVESNHLIGLSGPNASGKGEAAEYLKKKGYRVYSLSDVLRKEASKVGLDQSRKTLINFGYQLRKKCGEGILVKKLLPQIRKHQKIVVDSIRSPAEIKELRKLLTTNYRPTPKSGRLRSRASATERFGRRRPRSTVFILGIDAPERLRYRRLLKRRRVGDIKTFSEFVRAEKKENSSKKYAQQIGKCMQLADKIIINKGSLEELYKKIDIFLGGLKTED